MEIRLTEDDIMNLILARARASGLFPAGEEIEVLLIYTHEERDLSALVRLADPDGDAEEPSQ